MINFLYVYIQTLPPYPYKTVASYIVQCAKIIKFLRGLHCVSTQYLEDKLSFIDLRVKYSILIYCFQWTDVYFQFNFHINSLSLLLQ